MNGSSGPHSPKRPARQEESDRRAGRKAQQSQTAGIIPEPGPPCDGRGHRQRPYPHGDDGRDQRADDHPNDPTHRDVVLSGTGKARVVPHLDHSATRNHEGRPSAEDDERAPSEPGGQIPAQQLSQVLMGVPGSTHEIERCAKTKALLSDELAHFFLIASPPGARVEPQDHLGRPRAARAASVGVASHIALSRTSPVSANARSRSRCSASARAPRAVKR